MIRKEIEFATLFLFIVINRNMTIDLFLLCPWLPVDTGYMTDLCQHEGAHNYFHGF